MRTNDKIWEYLDYFHKEVFIMKEDASSVPLSGSADDSCDEIAKQDYFIEQFADLSDEELFVNTIRLIGDGDLITSRHEALMYIAWIVSCNYQEESNSCIDENTVGQNQCTSVCSDMKTEEYLQLMDNHFEEFKKLKALMVRDTNIFTHNGERIVRSAFCDICPSFVRQIDEMIMFGGWIQDRLEGKLICKRNITNKLYKLLGYNVK